MSSEAPRNSGQGELIPSQKPEGGIPRFFKRLFTIRPEPQTAPQTAPRIAQPPPGLENFAAGLNQNIDNYFASVRQQELDRQNAEALRLSTEASRKAQEEAKRKEIAEQEKIKRDKAITEANKLLAEFRIKERLEYVKDTVWEGKGQVRALKPSSNWLGGFEILHEFPSITKQEETLYPKERGPNYRWRYVPRTDSAHFRIAAIGDSKISVSSYLNSDRFYENNGYSGVWSKNWGYRDDPRGFGYDGSRNDPVIVQMDDPESETLLQGVIAKIIVDRIKRGLLPAQIEKQAGEEMLRVRPQLGRWNNQFVWKIYQEQHPYVPGSD